jgi:hypothetical protein
MSDNYKKIVKFIFSNELKDPLRAAADWIEKIHRIQNNEHVIVVSDRDPRWQQKIETPTVEEIEDRSAAENVTSKKEDKDASQVDDKKLLTRPSLSQGGSLFTRSQSLPPHELANEKFKFLLNLQAELSKSLWDQKGVGLFNSKVPDTIFQMRKKLEPLHKFSDVKVQERIFNQIKFLFSNYHKVEGRDPVVEDLYANINNNIGALNNNIGEEIVPLSQSNHLKNKYTLHT